MYRCCCHCPYFYRLLPLFRRLITLAECVLGIIRLFVFFSPIPNRQSSSQQKYESMYVASFIIDWISSIIPTFMGLFIALLILIVPVKFFLWCYRTRCDKERSSFIGDIDTEKWFRGLLKSRTAIRMISMDCNCPCYELRPKLRFQLRFGFLLFILILRIIATSLYVESAHGENRGYDLATMCAITIILVLFNVLLDLYRYCVWWHYTPYNDTTCCCCRSAKHVRYIPYILFSKHHRKILREDEECDKYSCENRQLEHVAIFHHSSFRPQPPWDVLAQSSSSSNPTYIGFHQTKAQNATAIVKSDFRPSSSGMLGPGTYFARSCDATNNKVGRHGGHGALFIAEIDMGRVFEVKKHLIYPSSGNPCYNHGLHRYVQQGDWHVDYDTCYLIHSNESLDEFCIKDPKKQILRWVVIIDRDFDEKIELCRMDTELDSTSCVCI